MVPQADWTPTQAVDNPIINNPYDEPSAHWVYKGGVPFKNGGRRPASYWFRTKRTGASQQELLAEEESDTLPLVNRLRSDVGRWRGSGYRGASAVTRDLLAHWTRRDGTRPLFFCQREAVETLIYLLEIAIPGRLQATGFKNFEVDAVELERLLKGEKPTFEELSGEFFPRLADFPADASLPLRRLGCKMATGSGKTVVMAMLIAWAFANRGRNPASAVFPSAVLICAPNLTVRQRLQVLRPEHPENYFKEFELVPAKYMDALNAGRVLVTNWHALALKSEHREGDTSYRVVDKGEESNEAFARDRLGELAARLPILVFNDEGHHCWRPKAGAKAGAEKGLTKEERDQEKEDFEEATVWLDGLDRINNAGLLGDSKPCISACVDLSATPFYLSNSGEIPGSPFPWLVSDFGLVDAIECGIVKIPRLPVKDDSGSKDDAGRPDPKYFRLWANITSELPPKDKLTNGRPKAEAVYREAEGALRTLASQWKDRFDKIRAASAEPNPIPPVMIVVCDNTEIAEYFFQRISGERRIEALGENGKKVEKTVYNESVILPEFANAEGAPKHTFRIDTKLLAQIETEDEQSKDEAAQELRALLATVGKRGKPGEQVRCVVSVSMLTEGWDATNVTHILGIRAFDSQLLCEQVVGRGLRRMSYTPDKETGLLPAEAVDIYGIPFSLIPFKGRPTTDEGTDDPVYHHVYAVPERESLEIRIPVVESYTYDLRGSGIHCDVDTLEGFVVQHEPTAVFVAPMRGYRDESTPVDEIELIKHDRTRFYESVRFQQVLFWLAQSIVDKLILGAEGEGVEKLKNSLLARHQVFPEVLRLVQEYVQKKVRFDPPDLDPRELALEKYAQRLCERILEGITPAAAPKEAPLVPIVNSFHPWHSTGDVNYRTTRRVVTLTKSHLNLAAVRSEMEAEAIDILEEADVVESYSPNDRGLGVRLPYEYGGGTHTYEPDFIVKLRGGTHLLLEIKGLGGEIWAEDQVLAKSAAAKKWVAAVNNARRFGPWAFEICRDLAGLRAMLVRHSGGAEILPFRVVEPKKGDHFKNCVPLTTLRAAAGRWSEDQTSLVEMGEWAEQWITYDTATKFEPGMFVARVQGDSMSPAIPDGAYCLFRQPRAGSRQGRRLLAWHSGVSDPYTGGQYTLKVYSSKKAEDPEGGWKHVAVTLSPLNPAHEPIELTPKDEGEVRVIAEFVEVLRPVVDKVSA